MDTPSIREFVDLPEVWDRMGEIEDRLLDVSSSEDSFLTEVAQHLITAGGKRFRPLLAMLAAQLGDPSGTKPVDAAVSVELIHIGSLYHDDVIDESSARRGAVSANANWDNTVAILAGDFLMARASELAASELGQESVRLLAATYAALVEGQTLELQLDFDLGHGPEEYERVIEGKTASLIRTSARLGAIAADCAPEVVDAVSDWAWEVGIVFQIADDVLDLVASDEYLGKPAGSDIGEGKFTLPVLHALGGPDGDRIRELLSQERPYSQATIDEVIDLVRQGGWIEGALDEATARLERAAAAVDGLGTPRVQAVLHRMGQFLIQQVAFARQSATA
ncbi:MAG: polyprenyl synthetase family protein [Acidimicrobiia bacterium]|nr:polyprenyl synthetase family protein [Acidimicrobiia bacterium]